MIRTAIKRIIRQSKFYIMQTMQKHLLILFFFAVFAWSAKPMEPVTNYNVIMVHGAADNVIMVHGAADNVINGFECEDAATEAYDLFKNHKNDTTGLTSWQIGGAPGMIGSYENKENLTYWLDTRVFEDTVKYGSDYIYIQRSFKNPADSPKNNAYEIGNPKWICNKRRSLIEEAQEVKAKGRKNLNDLRKDVTFRNSLPPSRNILIGHSMGGVASREYVQSDSIYNDDVDKVIALDSPHEAS